jgi:hypothetical protein
MNPRVRGHCSACRQTRPGPVGWAGRPVPPLLFGRRVRPIAPISQTPLFVGPSELVSEPGYHPEALVWLHPRDLQVASLSEKPTKVEVAGALGLLDELLLGLPLGRRGGQGQLRGADPAALRPADYSGHRRGLVATLPLTGRLARPAGTHISWSRPSWEWVFGSVGG